MVCHIAFGIVVLFRSSLSAEQNKPANKNAEYVLNNRIQASHRMSQAVLFKRAGGKQRAQQVVWGQAIIISWITQYGRRRGGWCWNIGIHPGR